MVVDDDCAMREFLKSFLTERGYQAIALSNAVDAVRHYQHQRPAAVILDLVMPGDMDGLAALAAFRKIDREVPVVVLSGLGRTTTVVQAMKLGASDFVSKPFDDADLEAGDGPAEKREPAHTVSVGINRRRVRLGLEHPSVDCI